MNLFKAIVDFMSIEEKSSNLDDMYHDFSGHYHRIRSTTSFELIFGMLFFLRI